MKSDSQLFQTAEHVWCILVCLVHVTYSTARPLHALLMSVAPPLHLMKVMREGSQLALVDITLDSPDTGLEFVDRNTRGTSRQTDALTV